EFSQIQRPKPDLLFLEFSGFYILSNLQLSRFFVVGLFSSNFYILSQPLVFVNNFFHFFISYSLALLVLTAAQEISYQMFRQMSTIIYNFFYTPLLHTFLHNTAHAFARAVSINFMVLSAAV
ncbi:hypothetical protein, partial [Enterocloster bolteae]|uniref:hypothetical protein n=2 Tax=Enterocloster bolteae TaxID=208479 RepID=UPI0028FEB1D9